VIVAVQFIMAALDSVEEFLVSIHPDLRVYTRDFRDAGFTSAAHMKFFKRRDFERFTWLWMHIHKPLACYLTIM
jgi:hypothetical protein